MPHINAYLFPIQNKLCMNSVHTTITCRVSNQQSCVDSQYCNNSMPCGRFKCLNFLPYYQSWRSYMSDHLFLLRFSVLHLASTKGQLTLHTMPMLQVFFRWVRLRCVWSISMHVSINQPQIIASLYHLVHGGDNNLDCKFGIHHFCCPCHIQYCNVRLPSLI